MNTTRNGPPPAIDEHHWRAQEDALAGAGDRHDALLARALATLPASQPPAGFAAAVARLAATRPLLALPVEPAFERVLLNVLAWILALAALAAAALYGGQWLAQLRAGLGEGAATWVLAAAACAGLSWALGGLRAWRERRPPERVQRA